ncbi:Tubulin-tyrosine ligase/Tubulin polyglutamylase like protein, partial [Aduncisulcus paluster]
MSPRRESKTKDQDGNMIFGPKHVNPPETMIRRKKAVSYGYLQLSRSIFFDRPHTVAFDKSEPLVLEPENADEDPPSPKLIIQTAGPKTNAIRNAFRNSSFKVLEDIPNPTFTVFWGKVQKSPFYLKLRPYQKVNHFPGTFEMGRKDRLWKNINRAAKKFGYDNFDISPASFCLPMEVDLLKATMSRYPDRMYIYKPNALSRGRGIRLITSTKHIPDKPNNALVQHYIDNPLLVNGYKFDLRIYVFVTSYEPLRAYIYKEGLARFATEKYSCDKSTRRHLYMHLTNYSLNKGREKFVEPDSATGDEMSSKWALTQLLSHLATNGVNTTVLWSRIKDLVRKTLIAAEPNVVSSLIAATPSGRERDYPVAFELYGFDVLIDDKLKPWLIEVNTSPSTGSPSPLDKRIKWPMLKYSM